MWTLCVECGTEGWPVLRDRVPPRPGVEKVEQGSPRLDLYRPLCKMVVKAEAVWDSGELVGTLYKRCSLKEGHASQESHRYIEGIGDYFSD